MTEWAVWRSAWRERKTINSVHGFDSFPAPDVAWILDKFRERYYGKTSSIGIINVPEVNEKFERIAKSVKIAEVSKNLSEIYRYTYDHYVDIPILEFSEMIVTSRRIPKWDTGSRPTDRNYNGLIKQR